MRRHLGLTDVLNKLVQIPHQKRFVKMGSDVRVGIPLLLTANAMRIEQDNLGACKGIVLSQAFEDAVIAPPG
jgi:hypothetical protein